MTLRLADAWVWDAWYATEGDLVHAFFLRAPRSLGDPDRRHGHARIGHAVSRDLVTWEDRGIALEAGPPGAFDARATWTGSVLRHDGRWLMFYTGIGGAADDWTQRIGLAVSEDLDHWARTPLVLEADPRWYQGPTPDRGGGIHLPWRDPWAWAAPDGTVHLFVTAGAPEGPDDGRGVIGHAWSRDLAAWEIGPPLTAPGEFAQLEVPQLVRLDAGWALLVNAQPQDHAAARRVRPGFVAEGGVHYLLADDPLGPYSVAPGRFLLGDEALTRYAGRLVDHAGRSWLMTFRNRDAAGTFPGELADPVPVELLPRGLRLAAPWR